MTGIPAVSRVLSPAAEPTQRVGKRWVTLIALANLGLYLGYFGPLEVLLPNQVQAVAGAAHKVAVLGWVTGIGAAVAMIANPVAGALSDRTTSRFGRRHPWTVCGALAGAAALALLAGQHTIAGLIIGWCLAQACLNAMQASVTAGVPDHVPVAQRGAVSGWIGLPQTFGVVLAVALVTVAVTGNAGYLLIGVLVVACALPFALTTPDPPLARAARPPFAWRAFARSFWLSPRRYPDFAWAWLTRFAVNLGNAMAVLYLLYFLRDRLHYSQLFPGQTAQDGLLILISIYLVTTVLTAVTGGIVSDRTGRRKALVTVAGLVMTIPGGHARAVAELAGGHRRGRADGPGLRRVPVRGPGARDPGAAVGRGPGQGPGHHQHRQLRAAGAGPGHRRAAGQPVRRVPNSVLVGCRQHRGGLGVRLEDPLGTLKHGAVTAGDWPRPPARYWR